MGVAFAQQRIDFPQRVLAASTGSESIARRHKVLLEDRLDDPFDRRLDDSVLHGRDGGFIMHPSKLSVGMMGLDTLRVAHPRSEFLLLGSVQCDPKRHAISQPPCS